MVVHKVMHTSSVQNKGENNNQGRVILSIPSRPKPVQSQQNNVRTTFIFAGWVDSCSEALNQIDFSFGNENKHIDIVALDILSFSEHW